MKSMKSLNNIHSIVAISLNNLKLFKKIDIILGTPAPLPDFLEEWFKETKNVKTEYWFLNQYVLIQSLYSIFVLPEQHDFYKLKEVLKGKKAKEVWKGIENNNDLAKDFIRHIRNGISHGTLSFDEELNFKIEDERSKFSVEFKKDSLIDFIYSFSQWLMVEIK